MLARNAVCVVHGFRHDRTIYLRSSPIGQRQHLRPGSDCYHQSRSGLCALVCLWSFHDASIHQKDISLSCFSAHRRSISSDVVYSLYLFQCFQRNHPANPLWARTSRSRCHIRPGDMLRLGADPLTHSGLPHPDKESHSAKSASAVTKQHPHIYAKREHPFGYSLLSCFKAVSKGLAPERNDFSTAQLSSCPGRPPEGHMPVRRHQKQGEA